MKPLAILAALLLLIALWPRQKRRMLPNYVPTDDEMGEGWRW